MEAAYERNAQVRSKTGRMQQRVCELVPIRNESSHRCRGLDGGGTRDAGNEFPRRRQSASKENMQHIREHDANE